MLVSYLLMYSYYPFAFPQNCVHTPHPHQGPSDNDIGHYGHLHTPNFVLLVHGAVPLSDDIITVINDLR